MTCKNEQRDRTGVFVVCLASLAVLAGISYGAISGRIPSDSQTLLGVIVGGLILFCRECLQAIRQFWADQRTGKLTDQLASASPATNDNALPDTPDPVDVNVAAVGGEPAKP